MSKILSKKDFNSAISTGYVLVDFFAEWCGPCKMLAPIIDELSNEMKGVQIAKVNVDNDPELSQKYNVSSIPTVILFKDGKQIAVFNGFKPKQQIIDFVNQNKNSD